MMRYTKGINKRKHKMTNNQKAHAAGYTAAANSAPRAPACSKVCMAIIAELSTLEFINHDAIVEVMKSFVNGYETRINEECAELLAA